MALPQDSTVRDFTAWVTGAFALALMIIGAFNLAGSLVMAALMPYMWRSMGPAAPIQAGASAVMLGVGSWLWILLRRREWLLASGASAQGEIAEARRGFPVRVNRRHRWRVSYRYQVARRTYLGREVLWDLKAYQRGAAVEVAYDPAHPGRSALRRHSGAPGQPPPPPGAPRR